MTKIVYRVGDTITVRGQLLTITRVYPFGTVDAADAHGRTFRVTGLPVYQ